MKIVKIFFVAALCSLTMMVSATVTHQATIKVIADGSGVEFYKTLSITADDAVSGDFATGSAEQAANQAGQRYVNVYVLNGSTKYGTVVRPDLNGLQFVFEANQKETAYKMRFSNVVGTFSITDGENIYEVEDDGLVNFECPISGSITFTVVISQPEDAYTRDVTADQWGTICYPAQITEVQGGVLYELTEADAEYVYGVVAELPTEAGKPYVFKANADATQLVMPYTAGTEALNPVTATGLVGTFYGLEGVPAGAYGILNNYVVEIAAGNPLLANRAYINMEDLKVAPGAPIRGRAIFMIQNAPTGLDGAAINGLQNGKFIMNGRFMIVKDGKTTNVLGL